MIFAILLHIGVFEIPILYIQFGKFEILVSYGQPGNFYIQPCQILICDIENFENCYAILTSVYQDPKSPTIPIHYSHSSYSWWKINSTDFLNIHLSTETSKCVKYANTLTLHDTVHHYYVNTKRWNHPHCNRIYWYGLA